MNLAPKPDLGAPGQAASARPIVEAKHHGRIVARTVLDPLDSYANSGQLTDNQHEAGMRVRSALAGSWAPSRVTAGAMYASSPSEFDDEQPPLSEQERHDLRTRHWQLRQDAEKACGEYWSAVRDVCGGAWASGVAGGLPSLRAGLELLVRAWKITE